ncbi:hypothetical protein PV327_002580 [Microctonus hyperodae]|uniref:Small ribosomal subunit protein uS7 domain-containing protein n=1 Tax=Microctonus hyperodae TaxID=165561 RepID=A0AA39FFY2_MICHY|nr:hypothetical protein PV327_002580 [Microctonus hyperodae]
MVLIQKMKLQTLIKFLDPIRSTNVGVVKSYSVFPPHHVKPVFRKNEQALIKETGEAEKLAHVPILPPLDSETSSEFYDPVVAKFTNYIMRKGEKNLARSLLEQTFEKIKRTQLMRYHKALPEERDSIILDPKEILFKAIENVSPVMDLIPIKRGGGTYQVPVPLLEKRQKFFGMNWLIKAAKDKPGEVKFHDMLAKELIDAANNQGRVVKKKHDLHKQCEANRAYAHYRWT